MKTMKKQSVITIILCILLAAVIILSLAGVKAQNGGSFAGLTVRDNEVSSPVSVNPLYVPDEYAFPSVPKD